MAGKLVRMTAAEAEAGLRDLVQLTSLDGSRHAPGPKGNALCGNWLRGDRVVLTPDVTCFLCMAKADEVSL